MKKMIILPSKGQVPRNGGMYGPINTPHMTGVYEIGLMLFYGEEVFEVLADGTKVKLTKENYDKDNSVQVPEIPDGGSGDGSGEQTKQFEAEKPSVQQEEVPEEQETKATIQQPAPKNGKRK